MPRRKIEGITQIYKQAIWKSDLVNKPGTFVRPSLLVDLFEGGVASWSVSASCTISSEATVLAKVFDGNVTATAKVVTTDTGQYIEFDFGSDQDFTYYKDRIRTWLLAFNDFTLKARIEDNAGQTYSSNSGTAYTVDDNGTAESGGNFTLTDSDKSWTAGTLRDKWIMITGGTGSGQFRKIRTNTSTILYVSTQWSTNPSSDSTYVIGTWTEMNIALDTDSGSFDESVSRKVRLYNLPTNATMFFNNVWVETTTLTNPFENITITYSKPTGTTIQYRVLDENDNVLKNWADVPSSGVAQHLGQEWSTIEVGIYIQIKFTTQYYPTIKPSISSIILTYKGCYTRDAREVTQEEIIVN